MIGPRVVEFEDRSPVVRMKECLQHCRLLVKQSAHNDYICTLFLPTRLQPPKWALSAFNIETGRIRMLSTTLELALARLQFWREALSSVSPPGIVCQMFVVGRQIRSSRGKGIASSGAVVSGIKVPLAAHGGGQSTCHHLGQRITMIHRRRT